MRTRYAMLVILAVVALAAVALEASAQTPPPASGDWVIGDVTHVSDRTVAMTGNVIVLEGGHLTLDNVDLEFHEIYRKLQVEHNGSLTMTGGSLSVPIISQYMVYFYGEAHLDGVHISDSYPVFVYDWNTTITNCTLDNFSTNAIRVAPNPIHPVTGPIRVNDNTINNTAWGAVAFVIGPYTGVELEVEVVGNTITNCGQEALYISCQAETLSLTVEDNTVRSAGKDAIVLDLYGDLMDTHLDGNDVEDVDGHGVTLIQDATTSQLEDVDDLRAVNCDGYGLRLLMATSDVPLLTLRNLTLTDNGGGLATALIGTAQVWDSNVVNGDGQYDVACSDGTIQLWNTTHRKGAGYITNPMDLIISYKVLILYFEWQNGQPVVGKNITVQDANGEVWINGPTGPTGLLGLAAHWDWMLNDTGLYVLDNVTTLLEGDTTDLAGPNVALDRDKEVTLTIVDDVLPELDIVEHSTLSNETDTELGAKMEASDEHSGVGLVQLSIDPEADWDLKAWHNATLNLTTGLWEAVIQGVPEGRHTLYARAFDVANLPDGGYAKATGDVIVIDLTAPVITVEDPADLESGDILVNASPLSLHVSLSDDAEYASVNDDEATLGALPPKSFVVMVALQEGENLFEIVAIDDHGNRANRTLRVVLDSVAPTVTITSPADGLVTSATGVTLEGTVDEALRDDTVTVNGIPQPLSGIAFNVDLVDIPEGYFTITVVATDLAGNSAVERVTVTVDLTAPVLALETPVEGLLTNEATMTVAGTVEAGASVTVNGAAAEVVGGAFAAQLELAEGENTVVVVAADAVLNEARVTRTVRLDTVAPELVVFDVVDGELTVEGGSVLISGTTEAGAWVTIDVPLASSDPWEGSVEGGFVYELPLELEEYGVTVTSTDEAGNTAVETFTVINQMPPSEPSDGEPKVAVDPVVTAAVVATTTIVVAAALAGMEFTRYSLLLLFIPLYARLKGDAVLDNKTRLALHGLIIENPGLHYNEIIREFGLTNGVAAYHLDVLEREGFVRSVRDGTLRRFFSTSTKVPRDFKLTPEEIRDRIVEVVNGHPEIPQKAIVDELGIGRTVAGYHLKNLVSDGFLRAKRRGRFTVYSRTKKRWNT